LPSEALKRRSSDPIREGKHRAINRLSVLHKRKKSGGKVYVYPKTPKMWSGFLIFKPTPFAVIFPGCLLLDDSSPASQFPEEACLIGIEKWEE
jgi:hypothetical protein